MTSATITALLNRLVPTSSPPDWEQHDDQMRIALADPEIRRNAINCTRAVLKLVEKTALKGFVITALKQQATKRGAAPAEFLKEALEALNREIAAADQRASDEAGRNKRRSDELMPLWMALGEFSSGIAGERVQLLGKILNVDKTRHFNNVENYNTGLSNDELALLGRLEPSDETVAGWKQRVQTIDGWLVQLAAYSADPIRRTHHLAGMKGPGFDFTDNDNAESAK